MAENSLPKTMNAFMLTGHGDLDRLVWHEDWPVPDISGSEVLIRVNACGLNNTDINTRTAWYSKSVMEQTTGSGFDAADENDAAWGGQPIAFPRIQGADVAGMVLAVGPLADASLVGKRVLIDTWLRDWTDPHNMNKCGYFGSECDGGYAQFTKVDERQVHVVTSTLSDAELATFATSYSTAENMLNRASVGEGDTIFITGASGGVGSALIQLANRRGARTIAYCSDAKASAVQEVGAEDVLVRGKGPIQQALYDQTGLREVSVVADVVGGEDWPDFIGLLARGGRYTCSGAIAGPMVQMDLRTFYLRDLTFTGGTIVSAGIFADLVGYIERDEIKPVLAQAFALKDLHDAQRAFIDKRYTGNIVVLPW